MNKKAEKYIRGIRNKEKKRYAQHYLRYLVGSKPYPQPQDFNLGTMGRQAVNMNLNSLQEKTP